jgi:LPXTG-motif cell wall-anchored protein
MQSTRHLARLAAASTATVFMTVAALGPVFAAEGDADTEATGKGAGHSAATHGSVKSEERSSDTGEKSHAKSDGKSHAKSDGKPDAKSDRKPHADTGEKSHAKSDAKTTGPDHSKGNAATTGEATSPQPESKADRTDRGANAGTCSETQRDHAYCSTRDGSPSQNGAGDGKATGKPCAGCVGKADNKNPKGQHPDGSDRNAGYECDRNQGIGKGNPAHTGCVTGEKPEKPGEKPEKPGEKPDEKPGEKPDEKPGEKPDEKPGEKPDEKPGEKPDEKPGEKPEEEVPAVTPVAPGGPGEVPVVAPVDEVAGVAVDAPAPTAWAPSAVAPTAGVLPATGAGDYAVLVMGGLGMLAAGGLLAMRRRPQSAR